MSGRLIIACLASRPGRWANRSVRGILLLLWVGSITGCTLYTDMTAVSLENAAVEAPENAVVYFDLSLTYAQTERVDDALRTLTYAAQFAEADLLANIHYVRGTLYLYRREYDQAIDALKHTLLLRSDHEAARYNFELALFFKANPDLQPPTMIPLVTPTSTPTPTVTPTPTQEHVQSASSSPQANSTPIAAGNPIEDVPMDAKTANQLLDALLEQQQLLNLALTPVEPTMESDENGW